MLGSTGMRGTCLRDSEAWKGVTDGRPPRASTPKLISYPTSTPDRYRPANQLRLTPPFPCTHCNGCLSTSAVYNLASLNFAPLLNTYKATGLSFSLDSLPYPAGSKFDALYFGWRGWGTRLFCCGRFLRLGRCWGGASPGEGGNFEVW